MTNKTLALIVIAGIVIVGVFATYNYRNGNANESKDDSNYNWNDNWNDDENNSNDEDTTPIEKKKGLTASSYSEALKLSGEEGLPILVIFSSNHCSHCKRMEENVYPDEKVKTLMDNYIVCKLNTSNYTNAAVAKKYKVEYVPAFVITNAKEENLKFEQKSMTVKSFGKWLDNPAMYDQPKSENSGSDEEGIEEGNDEEEDGRSNINNRNNRRERDDDDDDDVAINFSASANGGCPSGGCPNGGCPNGGCYPSGGCNNGGCHNCGPQFYVGGCNGCNGCCR